MSWSLLIYLILKDSKFLVFFNLLLLCGFINSNNSSTFASDSGLIFILFGFGSAPVSEDKDPASAWAAPSVVSFTAPSTSGLGTTVVGGLGATVL